MKTVGQSLLNKHELSDNDQTIGENKAPQHTHALVVKRRPIVAQE